MNTCRLKWRWYIIIDNKQQATYNITTTTNGKSVWIWINIEINLIDDVNSIFTIKSNTLQAKFKKTSNFTQLNPTYPSLSYPFPHIQLYPTYPTLLHLSSLTSLTPFYPTRSTQPHLPHSIQPTTLYLHPSHYTPSNINTRTKNTNANKNKTTIVNRTESIH